MRLSVKAKFEWDDSEDSLFGARSVEVEFDTSNRFYLAPWIYRDNKPKPPRYRTLHWLWLEFAWWDWRGWKAFNKQRDASEAVESYHAATQDIATAGYWS